ncbi:Cell division cycle-associated 7-like protein [Cytospora mali]|uniref:Cell division cycle-associated 7-like protein n=1 Tax=Cytospora mali TaxID=578113 RepID=A0A194VTK0_CYTMA|nr:Cell division cycle-associated 7-like protein [Valsa mali]
MPSIATHPQAKFDPVPPDLNLEGLVDRTANFEWVQRIPANKIRRIEFEKLVWYQVVKQGKPLVIEGWNSKLPKSLFSAQYLENKYNKKQEDVRDINGLSNIPMTMGHYLRSMRQLTDQWTPNNFRDERRQRLYMKDIDCPPEWHDHLRKVMPPGLFYWNENVEDDGSKDDVFLEDLPPAPAGDLMSSLPVEMRAQNLMCYIGHEGTYTPAHREMCGSLGQNIMVEASSNENGEKEGSSIWFMTETKDRQVVREYFLSMLGHDVEIEKHFAQVNAWKKATFPVYIVEQKPGDFILIPPLAPHQVWNRGTRTMKVAWNRTTVDTLDYALHEALPRQRLVCRDEQYKNKAIIYYTLRKYYQQLQDAAQSQMRLLLGDEAGKDSARLIQLKKDFKKLLQLFTDLLVDEMFGSKEKNVEMVPYDSCVICSYCRSNIFNKFLTCKHCVRELVGGDQDTYDVCMECYAMGRSCLCVSGLSWCEQWDWSELVDNYELWRGMVIYNDGYVDMNLSPLPLEVARLKTGRKSLAQICQEQLRRRPFNDISKPDKEPDPEPSEPEVDDQGRPKKPKRKKKKGDTYKCHTCCHKDYTYRLAFCTNPGCNQAYCYGVLYRAFDMMPQEVLQEERWQCPKCQGICNCGACRRTGNTDPYEPKNTYIGHDTRAIADDRSQESLVDFRVHNLNWLHAAGDGSRNHNSKRIQRLRQEAEADKAKDNADAVDDLANDDPGANQDIAVQPPVTNGFEDHGPADGPVNNVADYSTDQAGLAPQAVNGAETADVSTLPDPSASLFPEPEDYPDPSLLGVERRLGRLYYEQEDDPDKILFNPYQEPTERDILDEEFEESEWVKKSLRAAKRRARQDDDPDFVVRKSHKKKSRVDKGPSPDALQNLDPALLGEDTTMADAPPGPPQDPEQQEALAEADDQHGQDEELVDKGRPFDPNVPTLRHSRPKVSYADMDDIEEFNDVVPVKPKIVTPTSQPVAEASRDPVELAAEAMRAITGGTEAHISTPAPVRKRGPGRPRKSESGPPQSASRAASKPSTPQSGPPKRRGRPPRSSLAFSSVVIDDEPGSPKDATIEELEQQLAKELEADEEPKEPTTRSVSGQRRRGRPRKTVTTANEESGLGRATRSGGTPAAAASEPSSEKFMSMAERMALKGKKVKIGKRKSSRGAAESGSSRDDGAADDDANPVNDVAPAEASTALADEQAPNVPEEADLPMDAPEPASSDDAGEEHISSGPASVAPESKAPSVAPWSRVSSVAPPASYKESSRASIESARETTEPSPPPVPPKPAGPTIVRLGDSEDEDDVGGPTVVRLGDFDEDGYSYYSDDGSNNGSVNGVGVGAEAGLEVGYE